MDISLRTQQLNSLFSYDKKAHLEESRLEIIPFRFTQTIGASEINEFQKGLAQSRTTIFRKTKHSIIQSSPLRERRNATKPSSCCTD